MRARRDRGEAGRAREQRGRAARAAARRPDPHRDRHRRVREVVRATRSTSTSTAPDASIWNTTTVECTRSASRSDERISAAFDGIDQTVDLHDVDAPAAHGLRAGDRAERSERSSAQPPESHEERRHRTTSVVARASYDGAMEVAEFCSTSRVVIVAGKGGVGQDHGDRRARGHRGPRRPVGAHRRGRGQVGPAGDVRRARARLRRDRPRARDPGPVPHARRRARRLPRDPRHEAHLEAPRGVGRARRRRHRGARA